MGELPLRGLFLLFGAFALLSAGLKVRSSRRAGGGVSVLTLVEGLAGVVLMVTTILGVFPVRVTGGVGMGTAVLVLLSTMTHLGQVRALSRAREESASQRLYTSIKYGSDNGPAGETAAVAQESPAGSEGSPAESGGSPAEAEESPAESAEVDPVTAALRSGHFDEEAFLRSTSGEKGTQDDGDVAPGGEAPTGEAPAGEAPAGEDLPEGEEEP